MAGVRNEWVEPIAEPRGLPSNVTPDVEKQFDPETDHTPSFLLLSELEKYNWKKHCGADSDRFMTRRINALKKLSKDPSKLRVVFWFDS